MKQSLENIKSDIWSNIKTYKKLIIIWTLFFIISMVLGGFITFKIMQGQLNAANDKIDALQYAVSDKDLVEQIKIVNKAVDDLKKNKPVTERVVNNNETEIRYVEKTTPEDPDVDIQDKVPVAKIRYNEKTYDVPMQTTTKSKTEKDGTVKVNQTHEFTVDVTKVADRQIAAYKLSMDEKQRELNKELKEVKNQNRNLKIAGGVIGAASAAYLINKAFK